MMETKLWIGLCALLVLHLGFADHADGDHAAGTPTSRSALGTEAGPGAPVSDSGPGSSSDPVSHGLNTSDINPSPSGSSTLRSNTTTEKKNISVTAKTEKDNETNLNSTNPPPSHPPLLTSESHSSTSQPPHPTTIISTTHVANTSSADAQIPISSTPKYNTSHNRAPLPNYSTTPSNPTIQTNTSSTTSAPVPDTPMPEATTATSSTTQSSSTSSHELPSSQPSTNAPQTDNHPDVSDKVQPKSATTPTSSPSAQAKTHTDNPSQLNVGGDLTMVHDSPTLDPLLAGLVSAFIITAVIITLLLFLKLRRRDNGPEFRRLQDLPMDDMLEETPLFSY